MLPEFPNKARADAAKLSRYTDAAIELGLSLYVGIGAVRLDSNSVADMAAAAAILRADAADRAREILKVSAAGTPRINNP